MKRSSLAVVVLFLGIQVFAHNQVSKVSFNPDDLESFSPLPKFSFQWCPKEYKDFLADTIDLRSCDLSKYHLTALPKETLGKIDFDDKTIWPKKMPEWLDLHKIYQISKTAGLHLKDLHKQGITGRGVNIAIIDQALSPHQEYNKNIAFYKNFTGQKRGEMHGAAVASIAVGNSVGVAPDAKLYYVAANFSNYNRERKIFNAKPIAEAINYVLDLNKTLSEKDRIFVISISRGFGKEDFGRKEFLQTIKRAEKEGVLILTTNDVAGINRRDYYVNPQNRDSFIYAPVWDKDLSNTKEETRLAVPNDYRVLASPTGEKDYVGYADGGLSWAVPYLAGIAALAKQVKPDLTPEEFLDTAFKTAQSVLVKTKDGKQTAQINTFVNPQALIKELQSRKIVPNEHKENVKDLESKLKSLQEKK